MLKEGIKVRFLTVFIKNSASSTFKAEVGKAAPKRHLAHFHSCKFTRFAWMLVFTVALLLRGERCFSLKQLGINCTREEIGLFLICATRGNY